VYCGFDLLLKFQSYRPRGSPDGGNEPIIPGGSRIRHAQILEGYGLPRRSELYPVGNFL
jgi:hypothetical protein